MIPHTLGEDWSGTLPFGSLTLRTLVGLCRIKGCITGRRNAILFPDGRLRIKQGFCFKRFAYPLVPEWKTYTPSMVYAALDEFTSVLPFRSYVWKQVRKKLFLRMMHDQKVNFMTIAYMNWRL